MPTKPTLAQVQKLVDAFARFAERVTGDVDDTVRKKRGKREKGGRCP